MNLQPINKSKNRIGCKEKGNCFNWIRIDFEEGNGFFGTICAGLSVGCCGRNKFG